jgi:DNA-binding MarR family transcriptional regulator
MSPPSPASGRARPETPSTSPGFQLWLVTLAWQRAIAAVLRPHGLTHVQFVLLASIWWLVGQDGPPTQRRLADHAGTGAMMTSQVLRRLERKGLVGRLDDAGDARAKRVRLSGAGEALLARVLPEVDRADAEFFAPTGTAPLLKVLTRLTERSTT